MSKYSLEKNNTNSNLSSGLYYSLMAERVGFPRTLAIARRQAGAVRQHAMLSITAAYSLYPFVPPIRPFKSHIYVLKMQKTHEIVRFLHLAERVGFEPTVPFWGTHDFQSCSFGPSDISPYCGRLRGFCVRIFLIARLLYNAFSVFATEI